MCFSAEADIVAGLVVTGVGIDALRHVSHPRELALASLPLLLGIHQLVEVLVWWGIDGHVSASVGHGATHLYLAIAFVLPVLVPACVLAIEPDGRRRESMALCVGIGVAVSTLLFVGLATGPVGAEDAGHRIAYQLGERSGAPLAVLYILATCGALLASSSRPIVAFGVANLIAVSVLALLTAGNIASLWCAWAAVTSVAVALHLRGRHRAAAGAEPLRPATSAL